MILASPDTAASSLNSRSFYGDERARQTERAVAAALDSINFTHQLLPLGPPPFHFFPLQQQAFDRWDTDTAASSWAPHLRVYCEELDRTGSRRYILTTPSGLWLRYREMAHAPDQQPPHLYEIIRQERPCHLYFDLEFQRACNPRIDGDALVALLVELIGEVLQEVFGIRLKPSKWVTELDSTTGKKFSRHLIVRIKRCAFKDNRHVGEFVKQLEARIRANAGGKFSDFVVMKENGGRGFLHRHGSVHAQQGVPHHHSQSAHTTLAGQVTNRPDACTRSASISHARPADLTAHGHAMDTMSPPLLAHVAPDSVLGTGMLAEQNPAMLGTLSALDLAQAALDMESASTPPDAAAAASPDVSLVASEAAKDGQSSQAGGWSVGEGVLMSEAEQQLVRERVFFSSMCTCTSDWSIDRVLTMKACGGGSSTAVSASVGGGGGGRPGRSTSSPPSYGSCPAPLIQLFVESVCAQGGTRGHVRSWVHLAAAGVLMLNMRGNRWCGNIEAEHKSNGVFIVVDLVLGVWCQRCHDPECRAYRSPALPLPADAWQQGKELHAAVAQPCDADQHATGVVGTAPQHPHRDTSDETTRCT
ncbi:MAG: hypothetical protein WDW36_003318 [Sanguina aurantia]